MSDAFIYLFIYFLACSGRTRGGGFCPKTVWQAGLTILGPSLPHLSLPLFCQSHPWKLTHAPAQVHTNLPKPPGPLTPAPRLFPLQPSCSCQTLRSLLPGRHSTLCPSRKCSLPQPSFPTLESRPPDSSPDPPGSLLHCSLALGEGGAQPAVTPKVGWATPSWLPPAQGRARPPHACTHRGCSGNQNRRCKSKKLRSPLSVSPSSLSGLKNVAQAAPLWHLGAPQTLGWCLKNSDCLIPLHRELAQI